MLISLHIVYSSFCDTMAQLSSCDRDFGLQSLK